MSGISAEQMASKLLAEAFQPHSHPATELSDPIVDTPMVVTLDQLLPYDHNPRVRRNPLYDEIRASIRERGLDAPPAITRRPGEAKYIIRNGGNTRLAILHELWGETRDERFYRIHCLFRPWTVRGEITVLTGHLAENELHGRLSFVERALGVERARELYEQESQTSLSQSELARRLTSDGFPVQQSHISRMRDAIQYLLPAIPTVLYGGLGRHQVERLAVLRRACERGWELFAGEQDKGRFDELFHDTLSMFDGDAEQFSMPRFQDELLGQMSERLGIDYARLSLEVRDLEGRQRALTSEPSSVTPGRRGQRTEAATEPTLSQPNQSPKIIDETPSTPMPPGTTPAPTQADTTSPQEGEVRDENVGTAPTTSATEIPAHADRDDRVQGHIASTAPTTERLQSIQKLVADHLKADDLPDFTARALQAIPVQAGGLYPISDVWYIEPGLDTPEHLRIHIAQFAHEIAAESDEADRIQPLKEGLGYRCAQQPTSKHPLSALAGAGIVVLLSQLAEAHLSELSLHSSREDADRASQRFGALLIGPQSQRISDTALVKMFRLIRLGRRLLDLTTNG